MRVGGKGSKVIAHNNEFWWFASVADANGDSAIGVATSASPSGPFSDRIGVPLISRAELPAPTDERSNLDPTVIVVAGAAQLVWGHGRCYSAPLTPDLTGLAGPITTIHRRSLRPSTSAPHSIQRVPPFQVLQTHRADARPESSRVARSRRPAASTGSETQSGVGAACRKFHESRTRVTAMTCRPRKG